MNAKNLRLMILIDKVLRAPVSGPVKDDLLCRWYADLIINADLF